MTLAYQEYYTADDYTLWKGDWELIEGMPYAMSPSPSVTHQAVSTNLAAFLKKSLDNPEQPGNCKDCIVLMETDWQVSNDTVVRPDVMVVCQKIGERVVATPDLIMEVVSNSSTKRDEYMKFKLYQREGVPYYILVYPDKQLAKAYYHQSGKYKKLADYTDDLSAFEVAHCNLKVDFSAVWR